MGRRVKKRKQDDGMSEFFEAEFHKRRRVSAYCDSCGQLPQYCLCTSTPALNCPVGGQLRVIPGTSVWSSH